MIEAETTYAIVYCEGAFRTTSGKTAHGLVRHTERYRVLCVIDSTSAGEDAGALVSGKKSGIPIVAGLGEALELAGRKKPLRLVIGLAPDGGRLPDSARSDVLVALEQGIGVDCGLHDFLSEDPKLASAAQSSGAAIHDIRKPPPRDELHFFSGKIRDVAAVRIAVLGTDSAVGKRTTAWMLRDALEARGSSAVMIGTGQTAWLQGARYSVVMDSLINDFVSGELEHLVWRADRAERPDFLIIEGQGSLLHPAYPGGFEILAATRPHGIVLQHAPGRREYDGFPGFPVHPLSQQIAALELVSGKPVIAITINTEGLEESDIGELCRALGRETRRPVLDITTMDPETLVDAVLKLGNPR